VIEKYYGTFTQDSLWYWASAGKTLTAFTAGIAQQEGFLSIHDTSSKYLGQGWTNCPLADESKITVWNQLTMTSGLDDGVADPYCTDDTCLTCLADPGTRWAYHNAPYTLLDGVIEGATGQSLNLYFAQKVKNRIGMNGSFIMVDYNNVYFSNARSMARFGLLMLGKGSWNGTAIMTDTAYYNAMINTSQNLNKSYGYLWWLNGKSSFMVPGLQTVFPGYLMPNAPADVYSALGKNGQILSISPSSNLLFIRMGNNITGAVSITLPDDIWKLIGELECEPASANDRHTPPVQIFPNPAAENVTITGLESGKEFTLEIFDSQGRLFESLPNQSAFSVSAFPSGTYFIKIVQEGKTMRLSFSKI
jgi:CubicO group peptidase (beta-lactamase class C family)